MIKDLPPMWCTGVPAGWDAGHYAISAGDPPKATPWSGRDGYPLIDWHPERDGVRPPSIADHERRAEVEGEFVHLCAAGWTLIAAWDRSADKRGGCTMTFAMPGEFSPEDALSFARARFPRVFARIEQHLGPDRPITVRPAVPAVGRPRW